MTKLGRHWRIAGLCIAAGSALWISTRALAQVEDARPIDLNDALAALDADSYEARSIATQALALDLSISESQIAALMGRPDLTPEQSWRLMEALRERFLTTPRGAIGIRYNQLADPPRIADLLPDFPASKAKLLRVDDEIISIEGRPLSLETVAAMQQETFSRDPGDVLHMRIRRTESQENAEVRAENTGNAPQPGTPGTVTKILDIDVTLGSTAGFGGEPALDPRVLERAFAARMERMGVSTLSNKTIEPNIEAQAWKVGGVRMPQPMSRTGRVLSGPVGIEYNMPGRYGALAAAQQNARFVQQLNLIRQGGNAANLPNALNARVQIGDNVPGGGRLQIRRVQLPEELKDQNAARMEQVRAQARAQIAAAQQERAALQMELDGLSELKTPASPDAVGEANRLAAQIGTLEARIEAQTRTLGGASGEDPNVRRQAELLIDELRAKVALLRIRLQDTMDGRTARNAEASLDGE